MPLSSKGDEPITDGKRGASNDGISEVTTNCYPLTVEQIQERIAEFIASIDESAVCRLASKYNGQKPCSIVGKYRGSFNVCFFVSFDGGNATWVVRVPLEPCCSRYLGQSAKRSLHDDTTIPVPTGHAYGNDAELLRGSSKSQAFLVCDYVSGQSLSMGTLVNATEDQRKRLYNDLIDALSQLYELEFPIAGSLMPSPDNDAEPTIGPLQCMAANDLHRIVQPQRHSSTFSSDSEYLAYQLHILSETFRLPTQELKSKSAKMEVFAIERLTKQTSTSFDALEPKMPFVLSHQDLRCSNIIVTEDLRISGIIDWEFSGTVPRRLFTLPPWITGHDFDAVNACPVSRTALFHFEIRSEFLQFLEAKSTTSGNCALMVESWERHSEQLFPVAQILRQPCSLLAVYYNFLFPQAFGKATREDVVEDFFTSDRDGRSLAPEVNRRVEQSEGYTQYLKDHGLFVVNVHAQLLKEGVVKAKEMLESLK